MEGFPYNSKAINSNGSLASVVYLPPADATVAFVVFERVFVTMSGGTTMEMSPVGDISKVSNLGEGALSFTVETAGSLTQNQIVALGLAATGLGMDLTGTATTLSLLPSGATSAAWEADGTMIRKVPIVGALDTSWEFSGALISIRPFGNQEVTTDLAVSGVLGAVRYLGGAIDNEFLPAGSLALFRRNYIGYSVATASLDATGFLQLMGGLLGNADPSMSLSGELNRGLQVELPMAVSQKFLDFVGDLRLTGGLFGDADTYRSPSGNLSIGVRNPIPTSQTGITVDNTGALQGLLRMQGNVEFDLSPVGTMRIRPTMSANALMDFVLDGEVFNNAGVQEIAGFLMTRRATDREMTR